MKRFVIAALLGCGIFSLYAQNAGVIVTTARNRISIETISTRSRMVITAQDGSTSVRVLDQYSKDDAEGNARTVIVFQQPKNIAGSRFLTIDKTSGGSDRWIFLPALGKIRRIAASESGGSFMGTDFSYDDISATDREVSLDDHTLLGEEILNGVNCYKIQSVPKDSKYQYSKMIHWIGKEDNLQYKSEMYDRRGVAVKTLEMTEYKEVQGRLTPMQTKISTLAAGTSTTIHMDRIEYDNNIPEAVFGFRYLETGGIR